MKKHIRKVILIAVMLSFSILVFANSGPVFWQGYPSSEVMSIKEDTPIMVESEKLIFDFSDCSDSDFTISGRVTAAYEMLNPTNETQQVQMAFPFVGAFGSISEDDIVLTADNSVLPYDIYIGDAVDNYGNPREEEKEPSFDFASIVSNITDELYKAKSFKEDEKGKLYTIDVEPAADQRINFAVDFDFNPAKTKVLINGFNRYERNGGKTRIAAWCYEREILEIYVLGEDIDLKVNAYTDGELKEKTDLFTCRVSAQEAEFKPYLMNYIEKNTGVRNNSGISDLQLYNLYAEALDRDLNRNVGYSSIEELMGQEHYKRIFTIVYTVEFPPDSEKKVSVSYNTSGTMDMTETAKPLYTFDYILNPAENWSDFKNLNVEIIPPQEAPYIVKSSIEFVKGENNCYTAALANLPEEDLSFTLYENEKITLLDKAAGSLYNSFGYFYPFVIGAALIIGIIIMVIVHKHFKR